MKVYVQITSGRGPIECCKVVTLVADKIIKDWKSRLMIVDYDTINSEINII